MQHPFPSVALKHVLCTATTQGRICATPNHIMGSGDLKKTISEICSMGIYGAIVQCVLKFGARTIMW
jgi:hypothetical protein